jgi:AraC-like DNA-binding protein
MITRINNWLNSFEKPPFTYNDGYFYLPYLSNCPEIMIESMKKVLFTKHETSEKAIYSDNIFTDGALYYLPLEEGLWIVITEMAFKQNVATHAIYDSEASNYYSLLYFSYSSVVKEVKTNGLAQETGTWSLHKPGSEIKKYFNKGDEGFCINFAFSRAWFEQHIGLVSFNEHHTIREYFESDIGFITWESVMPDGDMQMKKVLNMMKVGALNKPRVMAIKALTLQIISSFFINVPCKHIKARKKIHEADKLLGLKTEKLLISSLTSPFPGIEKMAQLLHASPGKLRTTFKDIHNISIFQYYQKKQMMLALEMLRENPTSVKYIALTFGYQNPSKFSKAFKKHHNILPSQV